MREQPPEPQGNGVQSCRVARQTLETPTSQPSHLGDNGTPTLSRGVCDLQLGTPPLPGGNRRNVQDAGPCSQFAAREGLVTQLSSLGTSFPSSLLPSLGIAFSGAQLSVPGWVTCPCSDPLTHVTHVTCVIPTSPHKVGALRGQIARVGGGKPSAGSHLRLIGPDLPTPRLSLATWEGSSPSASRAEGRPRRAGWGWTLATPQHLPLTATYSVGLFQILTIIFFLHEMLYFFLINSKRNKASHQNSNHLESVP